MSDQQKEIENKNGSIIWHKILAEYFSKQALYTKKETKKVPNLRKLSELPYQQTYSNMWKELYNTLTDNEFLEQKNTHFIVYDLLGDYKTALRTMPKQDEVGKQHSVIQEFSKVLDQASFILKENPELTFSQVYNRLKWKADLNETLNKKLNSARDLYKRPWLCMQSRPTQSQSLIRTFSGHTNFVNTCAFSPDGKKIVSGGSDRTVKVWETETGFENITLSEHSDKVNACRFSPDGRLIASASEDNTIILWDAESYEKLFVLKGGHRGGVKSCAFSTDGNYLISGGSDWHGTIAIIIWDIKTASRIRALKVPSKSMSSCTFTPDGKHIVIDGRTVILWEPEISRATTLGNQGGCDVAFSPDGGRMVIANTSELFVWDVERDEKFGEMEIHAGYDILTMVHTCAYSPDGRQIASGMNEEVKLWDAETCHELSILKGHSDIVEDCEYSPDGRYVVSASRDKTLKLWDSDPAQDNVDFQQHDGNINSCDFSPDGSKFLSAGASNANSDVLVLWDVASRRSITTYKDFMWAGKCVFSPDGKRMASASKNAFMIRDVVSKKEIIRFEGWIDYVNDCTFSPDGKSIVSAGGILDEGELILWETKYGRKKQVFKGHEAEVDACDFSPDGRTIVSGGGDKMLKFWDVHTGEEILSLSGHGGSINACAYHPDGQTVVSAGGSESPHPEQAFGELILWDINKRKGHSLRPGHKNIIRACDISPDGRRIISGSDDETLKLWDTHTKEEIYTFKGFTGEIRTCKFSPDGTQIVLGDNWGQILLLELENFTNHPLILTSFKRFGRMFFKCLNCHSKGKLKMHLLGKEGICTHCKQPLKFNPFVVGN